MKDKAIMENILTLVKNNIDLNMHATIEASNTDMHTEMLKSLNFYLDLQKSIFDFMSDKGWYKMEYVTEQDIKKLATKLKNACE